MKQRYSKKKQVVFGLPAFLFLSIVYLHMLNNAVTKL